MPKPNEIRIERVNARITQKKAAKLANVHINTWHNWETGKSRMPEAIFNYFKVIINGGCNV